MHCANIWFSILAFQPQGLENTARENQVFLDHSQVLSAKHCDINCFGVNDAKFDEANIDRIFKFIDQDEIMREFVNYVAGVSQK